MHYASAATATTGTRKNEPENQTDDDERQKAAEQRNIPGSIWCFIVEAFAQVGRIDELYNFFTAGSDIEKLNLFAELGVFLGECDIYALICFENLDADGFAILD